MLLGSQSQKKNPHAHAHTHTHTRFSRHIFLFFRRAANAKKTAAHHHLRYLQLCTCEQYPGTRRVGILKNARPPLPRPARRFLYRLPEAFELSFAATLFGRAKPCGRPNLVAPKMAEVRLKSLERSASALTTRRKLRLHRLLNGQQPLHQHPSVRINVQQSCAAGRAESCAAYSRSRIDSRREK